MSKQIDLVNEIELQLTGAKAIVDVCRAVTWDGNRAAHHVGVCDNSISDALFAAQQMLQTVSKTFSDYRTVVEIKSAGPRAA